MREFAVAVHLLPGDGRLWRDDLWWAASLVREQQRVARTVPEATATGEAPSMQSEAEEAAEAEDISEFSHCVGCGPQRRRRVLLQLRAPDTRDAADEPSSMPEPTREQLSDAPLDSLADRAVSDSLVLMRL